jgi:hypothetical protein
MADRIATKLKEIQVQMEALDGNRRSSLLREIKDLEETLVKKKAELNRLNKVPS